MVRIVKLLESFLLEVVQLDRPFRRAEFGLLMDVQGVWICRKDR